MYPPKFRGCRPQQPACTAPRKIIPATEDLDRGVHGRTEVFFEPPAPKREDSRSLRDRCLNKRAMDLKQKSGTVKITGGKLQFGRHRDGEICPGKIVQDRGDLERSDKQAQTSLPSTGDPADLFPDDSAAALVAPEFHTTLRLADRIRQLELHEPDISGMVEERLAHCSCAAEQLRSRAYGRLNYRDNEHQYGNLIPVEVDEFVLIHQVEAEKQACVEAYRPEAGCRPAGPDVRDLMHLAVQHEFPVPPDAASLTVRPPPPRPVGFDETSRRASQRHRRIFSGQQHRH